MQAQATLKVSFTSHAHRYGRGGGFGGVCEEVERALSEY